MSEGLHDAVERAAGGVEAGDRAAAKAVVVLLHGFQMRPDDLAPFAHSLGVPAWFLFPEGPLEAQPEGRAWWHIDPDRRYLVVCNHQSYFDIPVMFAVFPISLRFVAKAELRSVPIFGRAMAHGGHVFVERSKHNRAVEAIAAAAVQMKEHGGSIVVFPEGTRSERAEIKELKKGGFHLAREAGVPIVPVGIRGSRFLMPKHGRLVRSGAVEVRIGEPMRVEAEHGPELDRLVEEVRLRLSELALLPLAAPRSGPRAAQDSSRDARAPYWPLPRRA